MSEHSAGGQTFTMAVAEPGPDNALRWPEKKAKRSDGLCRGSSKDISQGAVVSQYAGILWSVIYHRDYFAHSTHCTQTIPALRSVETEELMAG